VGDNHDTRADCGSRTLLAFLGVVPGESQVVASHRPPDREHAPHLALTPSGSVVMSWLEPTGEKTHALKFATRR
jgi:hypothetical protein